MQKKSHLLTDLKKQVLILKNQLENIERHRTNHHRESNSMNRSTLSQSTRFNSSTCDSTYLDRGVKKFPLQEHQFKNLPQLISQKSKVQKQPCLSQYRFAEEKKTRQNFSTDVRQSKVSRSKSPNPLTGQGYSDKKKGIKTKFESLRTQQKLTQRSHSGRKHFPVYIYR